MEHPLRTEAYELWPRLTRFYGLAPGDIARLPRHVLKAYVVQMDVLAAEEQLAAFAAASWPYMDDEGRAATHRRLTFATGQAIDSVPVDVTREADARKLASMGIRVVT